MKMYDLLILGGGAGGLFAAATASGARVLVLEKQDAPGRKLLLSGGGNCNITNLQISDRNYLGEKKTFCRKALRACGPDAVLSFFTARGLHFEEREYGQMFCREGSRAVLDALLSAMRENGSELRTGCTVSEILVSDPLFSDATGRKTDDAHPKPDGSNFVPHEPGLRLSVVENLYANARFCVRCGSEHFYARNLLLATGGRARPGQAKSYLGYVAAAFFGHRLVEPMPALCPLPMPGNWPLHGLQGLSVPVHISLQGADAPSFHLPLLFTHQGLSGPAALQISSYYNHALKKVKLSAQDPHDIRRAPLAQQSYGVALNFLPDMDLMAILRDPASGKGTVQGILRKSLPERLVDALLDIMESEASRRNTPKVANGKALQAASAFQPPIARNASDGDNAESARHPLRSRRIAELSRQEREVACKVAQRFFCIPEDTGFSVAESTLGGISVDSISSETMQSRLAPGLFFCGELLDVCGWLGGYNLHWAWASGRAVARAVSAQCALSE